MHEAHAHPVRDHDCSAFAYLREPFRAHRLGQRRARRVLLLRQQLAEVPADGEVDQLLDQRVFAARGRQLEIAEADERRRDTADDGALLGLRMAVVEHVAHDRLAGRHEAERARGRHAQVVHRFAAQELTDRRTQHRAAVGGTRIRRQSRALELQFPALAGGVDRLAECDGATVAELPCPVAELVAAIIRGIGLHAFDQRIAADDLCEFRCGDFRCRDAQQRSNLARPCNDLRSRDRSRIDARIQRAVDLPRPRPCVRIGR